MLYRTITAHWGELCERATDAGGLPHLVVREVEVREADLANRVATRVVIVGVVLGAPLLDDIGRDPRHPEGIVVRVAGPVADRIGDHGPTIAGRDVEEAARSGQSKSSASPLQVMSSNVVFGATSGPSATAQSDGSLSQQLQPVWSLSDAAAMLNPSAVALLWR